MFARLKSNRGANLFVELAMIVVGINIALWFEGWFDDLQDAETERQYLAGLRDDLQTDLANLDAVIRSNEAKLQNLEALVPTIASILELPAEEQAQAIFEPSNYWFFNPSDFTYRAMQESGDFRLISDEEIKKGLLRQIRKYRHIDGLQVNFLQALDDEYIPLMMSGFDIMTMQITEPAMAESQVFRNFFAYTYQDTDGRLAAYKDARDAANQLLGAIEAQLGGN